MQIKFPIQYEILGTRAGNMTSRSYAFRETVTVDIREVVEELAPIAVEWTPNPHQKSLHRHSNSDCNVSGPDGLQMTRWMEGRHWKRLCEGHLNSGEHFSKIVRARKLEEILSDPSQSEKAISALGVKRFEGVTLPSPTKWIETDSDPTDEFSHIVWDGRADAMNQLAKVAKNLIEVNGGIHQYSFEPYISVVIARMGAHPVKEIGVEGKEQTRWNVGNKSHAMFAVDDWERAVEFALSDEIPTAAINSAIDRLRPRVLIPESICYDWQVSYQVASRIGGIIKQLKVHTIPVGRKLEATIEWADRKLQKVVESADADEQYEILASIDHTTVKKWQARGIPVTPLWEALAILEDRPISVGISRTTTTHRP